MISGRTPLLALLCLCLACACLQAVVVTGSVLDPLGGPAAGVSLEYIDRVTGQSVPLVGSTTDLLGLYSVDVPVGVYTVRYRPPGGPRWAPLEERTVWITGPVDRPPVQMPEGWRVTGTLQGTDALPVVDADLDFVDVSTGERIFTSGDNTDLLGFFSVFVPCGTYDINFDPPAGHPDAALLVRGVVVPCADVDMGLLTLPAGATLSGTVTERISGLAVVDADMDVLDPVTRESLPTPRDNTDLAGAYSLTVPPGTYTIRVDSPAGSRILAQEFPDIVIAGPTVRDFQMETGWILSGTITAASDGSPVEGVNVDVKDSATRRSVRLSNDSSNVLGSYSVAVPTGTFDLEYSPPRGTRYVAARLRNQRIESDTVRDIALEEGFLLTGRVLDAATLNPVAGADLDLADAGGLDFFLPYDNSDASGLFELVAPPGTGYALRVDPPGPYVSQIVSPVDLTADPTDVGDILLQTGVEVFGRVLRASDLTPVPDVNVDFIHATLGWVPTAASTGPDGTFRAWVPEGDYTLDVLPDPVLGLVPLQAPLPGVAFPGPVDAGDLLLQAPGEPRLFLSRNGPDVVLNWTDTGAGTYTAEADADPSFPSPRQIFSGAGLTATDTGAIIGAPDLIFYQVR